MPRDCTWCLWLNGTGCSRATCASVIHGERLTVLQAHVSAASANTAPKIDTLEKAFVLGWNSWAMEVWPGPRASRGTQHRVGVVCDTLSRRSADARRKPVQR